MADHIYIKSPEDDTITVEINQGFSLVTALSAGDNVSLLTNDAGYLTSAPVDSVAGKTGAVTLVKADITDFSDADYATAAQGTLANTALQAGDNVSTLVNDSGYITSAPVDSVAGKTGVVTLVKADITDFVGGSKLLASVQNRTQGVYTGVYNAIDGAGTDTAITPMNLTITPTSSSSKVVLEWVLMGEPNVNGYLGFVLKKDGVLLSPSTDGINGWSTLVTCPYDGANGNSPTIVVVRFVEDNVVAGVPVSYDVCVRATYPAPSSWYHNRVISAVAQQNDETGMSTATAIEYF